MAKGRAASLAANAAARAMLALRAIGARRGDPLAFADSRRRSRHFLADAPRLDADHDVWHARRDGGLLEALPQAPQGTAQRGAQAGRTALCRAGAPLRRTHQDLLED